MNNKLLYEFQSGFRSNYSLDTCLIHLCDFIRQECDQGKYTGMVTLDLQKAFDTVNHTILLAKIDYYSIHEWLVDNKLSLHLDKMNTILFGSKKRVQQNNSIQVKCNGNDIESKQQVMYLGLILYQLLFSSYPLPISTMHHIPLCKCGGF